MASTPTLLKMHQAHTSETTSTASTPTLPKTHRALVLNSTTEPPTVQTIATPQSGPGSAIVQVIVANVLSYSRDIYNGKRNYAYPTPLVIGCSAIARIASLGPDATALTLGQLVLIDSLLRGRDDPTAACLSGVHEGFTDGSRTLMRGEWRDSTYAEYMKVPLENCVALDEKRLLGKVEDGGLGYEIADLTYLSSLVVPYGGLRSINLQAGETVIVAPATGSFGGAAVHVATAMGARVIAMGRNKDALAKVAGSFERVEAVPITGDVAADMKALQAFGPIDAYFDISPPQAAGSTHLKSGIMALRPGGRVSLMGGIMGDVAIPHSAIMHRNLTLKGCWMYTREDLGAMAKLVERGVLKLGPGAGVKVVGQFGLGEWAKAFDTAAENAGVGLQTIIKP
ncbi:hypothetical protein MMC11_002689 [Xylographa trunciseda]|nr:hypothetical protein [Xylographa trunciseda]